MKEKHNQYCQKILDLVSHIENHISQDLCLDSLVDQSGFSKFHLHRVFSSLADISIANYIRGRKLSHSLEDLKNGALKVIDIALKYGFSYEQSYIRAFKNAFNITPHQYRKSQKLLEITPRLTLDSLSPLEEGLVLPMEHKFIPQQNLISMPTKILLGDPDFLTKPNSIGRKFFIEESPKVVGDVNPEVYYSIVTYVDRDKGIFEYCPSFTYKTIDSFPDTLQKRTLPGGEYISFKYIGNHSPFIIDMNLLSNLYALIEREYFSYIIDHCETSYKVEHIDQAVCSDDYCELNLMYKMKSPAELKQNSRKLNQNRQRPI